MHPLEKAALLDIVAAAGMDIKKAESVIDQRLSFSENKRVIREWCRAEGKVTDLRTEIVVEKELTTKMAEAIKEEVETKESAKYAAVSASAPEIDGKITGMVADIMKEIEEYNPHMKQVTYSTLFSVMNGRSGKQKTNTINLGKQGTGKSRSTSDLLERLEISDAVIIKGFMTPKKVFETLKRNYTSTICFDEAENIFNSEDSLFVLRPALFGGTVSWITSKGEAVDSFSFIGTVIANMNHFGVSEAAAAPLFDRCLYNSVNLDNAQLIEKIQSMKAYSMNAEIWKLISDKITLIRTEGLEDLTEDEDRMVMGFIVEVAKDSSVFNKSLSARAKARAYLVARCIKSLFCGFGEKEVALFRELARPYICTEEVDDLCVKILRKNPNVTRKELTELISEQRQISNRQATRLISAAIERGSLIAINRTKIEINTGVK